MHSREHATEVSSAVIPHIGANSLPPMLMKTNKTHGRKPDSLTFCQVQGLKYRVPTLPDLAAGGA